MRPTKTSKFHARRDDSYDLAVNNLRQLLKDFKRGAVIGVAVVELCADGRNQDWYGHRMSDHSVERASLYRYLAGAEMLKDKFIRMRRGDDEED